MGIAILPLSRAHGRGHAPGSCWFLSIRCCCCWSSARSASTATTVVLVVDVCISGACRVRPGKHIIPGEAPIGSKIRLYLWFDVLTNTNVLDLPRIQTAVWSSSLLFCCGVFHGCFGGDKARRVHCLVRYPHNTNKMYRDAHDPSPLLCF